MSRIGLVSKNLLANVFRNCRKRNTVIEKKLCQKITYKYQSFHIAKSILLTFEIFAIFAIFLLYFSDSRYFKSFLLKLRQQFASKFLLTRSTLDISDFVRDNTSHV